MTLTTRIPWLLSILLLATCARNPATGERQLSLISREQEIQLGEEAAKEVEATLGLVEDPELQQYVSRVGKRLAARSEAPDLPWRFGAIDDPTPNAFALPGGKIYVTRGMLVHMNNEAQLAGVLGHEIGHVTARHSAEQLSKAQLAQVGLGLGAIFVEQGRELLPAAAAGLSVLFLKFGRDDEYQADELGVRYSVRGNYDVQEMPHVFETLGRVSEVEGGGRVPEWLSTHPNPENRIERIEEEIKDIGAPEGGDVDTRPYLTQVSGLVYGQDPRQGFFRGDRFYHPGLKFSFAIPENWQRVNYPEAVLGASEEQDAVAQLTLAKTADPEGALLEFSRQEGVRMGEPADLVPELPSASANFVANAQEGVLRGVVSYVALGGHTFEILAVAPEERFDAYAETFSKIHGSFEPVEDPKLLDVKPAHVELLQVKEATTLKALYEKESAGIPLDRIALINQLEENAQLKRGQLLKWVSREGTSGEVDEAPRAAR